MTSPPRNHHHLHNAHATPPQQGLHLDCTSFLSLPSTLYSSSNCTAHSLLLDPIILSLPSTSSLQHLLLLRLPPPDGTLLQFGGFPFGDWLELPNYLSILHFYSSSIFTLPTNSSPTAMSSHTHAIYNARRNKGR
ncbi:hypothetical protein QJS10_CPB18g00628 [Acorus calamus]|uniref:Uncharacterized protein n=1 Tax=Acorus calamus TaxID=4465 RepID=A0AAV9CJJ0_ACOCL|nr:hypothetical protein QJS10_CPB18g00628 [Acorus calamus]